MSAPKPTVAILRIGRTGNIANLSAALKHVGAQVEVVAEPVTDIRQDYLVLPGVGAFTLSHEQLQSFRRIIKRHLETRPVLGICLGMQILAQKGSEFVLGDGLGLIGGKSVRLPVTCAPLPHFGWAQLKHESPSEIFKGINRDAKFYFMHSNAIENCDCATSFSEYAGQKFVSSVKKGSLYGVQFHPERSREAGLALLENFTRL